jgi:hypothetical protein
VAIVADEGGGNFSRPFFQEALFNLAQMAPIFPVAAGWAR